MRSILTHPPVKYFREGRGHDDGALLSGMRGLSLQRYSRSAPSLSSAADRVKERVVRGRGGRLAAERFSVGIGNSGKGSSPPLTSASHSEIRGRE